MNKRIIALLFLFVISACESEKKEINNNVEASDEINEEDCLYHEISGLRKIIDKWNQLAIMIAADTNYMAGNQLPMMGVDSCGFIHSEDVYGDFSFDSINQRFEYNTELVRNRIWQKSYKGKEVLIYLRASIINQYNENTIKVYRDNEEKLIDITKEIFPYDELIKHVYESKLADTIVSTLDPSSCLVIALEENNAIKIYQNDYFLKNIANVEIVKDSNAVKLEWSESEGYVIK